MPTKMYKLLGLFTVIFAFFIATGNTSNTGAVQYEHLDLGTAVYNALKSHYPQSFGISPHGLGTLLTAISHEADVWKYDQTGRLSCYHWLHYEEPLGTNESIAEIKRNNFQDVKLNHANKVYVAKYSPFAAHVPKTDSPFPLSYAVVDFHSNAESQISNEISNFFEGRIKNPIPSGSIDRETSLISMNLLSFEGSFKKEFQESIFQYDFYKDSQSIGEVPFLHLRDQLKYVHSDQMRCTIVEIPYKEEGFSMIAVLPDVNTHINETTTRMHLPQLWRLLDRTDKHDVVLKLPKLKIESSLSLRDALNEVDLPEQKRCFLRRNDPDKGFAIQNDIRQIIFFAVNAEASASEQQIYSTWKTNPVLKFDRPFLIVLRYKELSLIMAAITNPTQQSFVQWLPFH